MEDAMTTTVMRPITMMGAIASTSNSTSYDYDAPFEVTPVDWGDYDEPFQIKSVYDEPFEITSIYHEPGFVITDVHTGVQITADGIRDPIDDIYDMIATENQLDAQIQSRMREATSRSATISAWEQSFNYESSWDATPSSGISWSSHIFEDNDWSEPIVASSHQFNIGDDDDEGSRSQTVDPAFMTVWDIPGVALEPARLSFQLFTRYCETGLFQTRKTPGWSRSGLVASILAAKPRLLAVQSSL
jgi:hypothetical protein